LAARAGHSGAELHALARAGDTPLQRLRNVVEEAAPLVGERMIVLRDAHDARAPPSQIQAP